MRVQRIPVGELDANCFIATDEETGQSFVTDPGSKSAELTKALESVGNIRYILLTHGHFDHIGYAAELRKQYPDALIVIGRADSGMTMDDKLNLSVFLGFSTEHFTADILVDDGDELEFAGKKIIVAETPGHTRGGVCYIVGSELFTGDTLMKMTMGRSDFPGGNEEELFASLGRIAALPGDYAVHCGHGPDTTLGDERKYNEYMKKGMNQ